MIKAQLSNILLPFVKTADSPENQELKSMQSPGNLHNRERKGLNESLLFFSNSTEQLALPLHFNFFII